MSRVLTERLIQRQINHWNRLRGILRDEATDDATPPPLGPVITVSRLAGAGGRLLAETLSNRLDLDLHDQSVIERIVRQRELHDSVIDQLDEKTVSQVHLWVQGVLNQRLFLRDDFHTALVATVTALAARGNAVFLGRGANLILGARADLRLRVVAGPALRERRLAERMNLDADQAACALRKIDSQRTEFVNKVFHQETGQPENYDLVFNTDHMDVEEMVDHVMLALARGAERRAAAAAAATA